MPSSAPASWRSCPTSATGSAPPVDERAIIDGTRRWISSVVIGLNLCPFARRAFQAGRLRYAVSGAGDAAALLRDLTAELEALASSPASAVESALLIHPRALGDF